MQRVAAGDTSGLAELYDATCAHVHGVAVRILGDAQAAEEITVEVFHQAWTRAADFDPDRGSVPTWLMTMARNRAIDRLRSRAAATNRADALHEQAIEPMDRQPSPDIAAQLADRGRELRRALYSLPPEQSKVIELAFFEGLSHSAIAKRLDEPLGTIKTRIRTGIRKLAEHLQPLEDAE